MSQIITHRDTATILNKGRYNNRILKYKSTNLPPILCINNEQDKEKKLYRCINIKITDETTIESVIRLKKKNPKSVVAFLNFANEFNRGGSPGLYWDNHKKQVIPTYERAGSQEENIIEKSTAFLLLLQIRYPFNSEQKSFLGTVEIFATDNTKKTSKLIEKPIEAKMITSAALHLGKIRRWDDIGRNTVLYKIRKRIHCHLLAAKRLKKIYPQQKIVLVLGAFGCGAFAPRNWNGHNSHFIYAAQIAEIYKDLLINNFNDDFDQIVFAIPTFGSTDKNDINFLNYQAFNTILH